MVQWSLYKKYLNVADHSEASIPETCIIVPITICWKDSSVFLYDRFGATLLQGEICHSPMMTTL